MEFIKTWGLWRSFETAEDRVYAGITMLILMLICVLLKGLIRPTCYKCGKTGWLYNYRSDVVSGSGPETCESAARCLEGCEVMSTCIGKEVCTRTGCNKDICAYWDTCEYRFEGPRHSSCPCVLCPKV